MARETSPVVPVAPASGRPSSGGGTRAGGLQAGGPQVSLAGRRGGGGTNISKLSILLVVANAAYGGAERHVVDLSAQLARRGHRVACLFPSGLDLAAKLPQAVRALPVPGLTSAWGFLTALRRVIRDFAPDVVHLHGPRATLLGRPAVRAAGGRAPGGVPAGCGGRPRLVRPALVATAHGWIPRRLALRRLFEAIYLWSTSLDDATIAVSRDTARRFGRWGRRVLVVPNGIAATLPPDAVGTTGASGPFAGVTGGAPELLRLGFLGRLTVEKGFPLALAAFAEAKAELARGKPGLVVELHVYGDGPLLPEAKLLTSRSGLGGVFFHGWVPPVDVPGVLAGLSALLLTSREEGMPYVLLEALAAGCPVVATAVGGIPEVIENGKSGWLADPGNAHDVARAVVALAEDPGLAAEVRTVARLRAGEYSLEAMADRVEEVYRAVVEEVYRSAVERART